MSSSPLPEQPLPDGDPLEPFTATAADPFDARKAAHLLRRTGFGATFDDV